MKKLLFGLLCVLSLTGCAGVEIEEKTVIESYDIHSEKAEDVLVEDGVVSKEYLEELRYNSQQNNFGY